MFLDHSTSPRPVNSALRVMISLCLAVIRESPSLPCHKPLASVLERASESKRFAGPSLSAEQVDFRLRPCCRGEQPMTLLKAVLKALTEWNPTSKAISEME